MSKQDAANKGETPFSGTTAYLVVTAVGKDRPGIVDDFSKFILERQCNIEDSRMAVLGGEFALIVLVAGTSPNITRIQDDLKAFSAASELSLAAKLTHPHGERLPKGFVPYRLRGTGVDHPGIVQKFSHALHEAGANIESLDTRTYSAPVSGTPIFHFDMVVEVPSKLAVSALRQKLLKLADSENLDLEIHPIVAGQKP